tara:strand:+ start:1084 stop:3534 length:2451 start_codon:yes stop_codon:yes gene_type:complete
MAKQLSYRPLTDIGINGLNTQSNPASLDPSWLVKADNIVIRESGRVSIRKGLQQKTTPKTSATTVDPINSMVEHIDQGTTKTFASHGTSIYTVDFTSPNAPFPASGVDVKHTVAGTAGDWQFINFNNRLHCLHEGVVPQRYDGSAATDEKWSNTYTTNAINIANGSSITAPNIVKDKSYEITALGNTDFTLLGADTDEAVGDVFTALTTVALAEGEEITADKIASGKSYKIVALGDSSFHQVGATSSPAVDEVFTANTTGGTGTGTVVEVITGTTGTIVEVKTNPTLDTITVDSSSGFPTSGQINIGEEIISYTGKTSTTFTGCTRGAKGTIATHHLDNAVVTNDSSPPTVTSGEFKPTCGTGFYGRLWLGGVTEEKDVLHYSALLDGDDFTLRGGGGAFDLKNVWGKDEITAIAPFYGQLAVFGRNNIALYSRPDSVSQMQLSEVIRGIGCIARDSVQAIGDDLVFLSSTGLRSLARTSEKDKVPLTDLSVNIKDTLIRNLAQSTRITSGYIENEGVYILSFPDNNLTYVFDFKHLTPNQAPRITTWTFANKKHPTTIAYTSLYGMLVGQADGGISEYTGYYDTEASWATATVGGVAQVVQASSPYTSDFATVWLDLGQSVQASLLKRLFMTIEGGSGSTLFLKWYKDFNIESSKITSIILNPRTLGLNSIWGKTTKGSPPVVQPVSTLYGTQPVTTVTAGAFVVGTYYAIASLGNTTQSQWNTAAGTSNVTYVVGDVFKAAAVGAGSGTVVSHVHIAANHIHSYTYAPIYGLKEYRTPLIGSAKYLKINVTIISNGYSTSLQNMTLLHKEGKIR